MLYQFIYMCMAYGNLGRCDETPEFDTLQFKKQHNVHVSNVVAELAVK